MTGSRDTEAEQPMQPPALQAAHPLDSHASAPTATMRYALREIDVCETLPMLHALRKERVALARAIRFLLEEAAAGGWPAAEMHAFLSTDGGCVLGAYCALGCAHSTGLLDAPYAAAEARLAAATVQPEAGQAQPVAGAKIAGPVHATLVPPR